MSSKLLGAATAVLIATGAGASQASATFGVGLQLYSVNVDGTGKRSLSDGKHVDRSVATARTGLLSFVRETLNAPFVDDDVGGIWTARYDGSNLRRIVPMPVGCSCVAQPLWSPDGRRLAFVRTGPTSERGLWTVNADGTGLQRLVPFATSAFGERALSWSPDGRWLAYQYADPDACGLGEFTNCAEWSVRLIASTGGPARVLARNASDPRFSPDGTRVAYRRTEGGDSFGLYIVRRDGRGNRAVWPKLGVGGFAWMPRASRLIFTWRDGLYSIGLDRKAPRRLGAPAALLEWAPNGRRAAYIRFGTPPTVEVWTMEPNGKGRRRVATTDGFHPAESLAWSRDGRTIFFTG